MKLRVLSLIVPALLVAGTAGAAEIYNKDGNKLDLFGKIDGLHYFSDDKGSDGDQSYMRFGLRGETQISDQLTGYGEWEYQANLNHAESQDNNNFTRVGFAGLKFSDYGSLDYGRNYGVLYDIGAWTDVLPEFGGDTYGADNFMFQRTNGVLTYRNSDFFGLVDGLNFALQYQGKNDSATESNNGRDVLAQNGDVTACPRLTIWATVSALQRRTSLPTVPTIRTAITTPAFWAVVTRQRLTAAV